MLIPSSFNSRELSLATKQSDRVLVASIDGKDPLRLVDVEGRQRLKDFEDQLTDITLVLDSTHDTIVSLLEKYQQFCRDYCTMAEDVSRRDFDPIDCALQEKQRDVRSLRQKVESLKNKVNGTTALVSQRGQTD